MFKPKFYLGLIRITANAWLFLACLWDQLHRRLRQLTGVAVSCLYPFECNKDGAVKLLVQNAVLTPQTIPMLMGLDLCLEILKITIKRWSLSMA